MRPRIRYLLFLTSLALLALPAQHAAAQPGTQMWSGIVHADAGKTVSPYWHEAIAVARSGYVYAAGTQAAGSDEEGFLVARFGADGALKWTRSYDKSTDEVVTDIAADPKGGVVVCGREGSYEGFLVVKFSRSGVRQWVRRIVEPGGLNGAEEIAIDATGFIYVVGEAGDDLCLVKYSPAGRRVWRRTYAKAEICPELALGPDGRLYVGMSQPEAQPDCKVIVACYTTGGHREWLRTIGTPGDTVDWIWDLDVRRSGVCGTGQSSLEGSTDGFVFRLRLDGTTKYWHQVDGTQGDAGASFTGCGMDSSGRVSVTGWSGDDFVVRRYRSNGTVSNASAWDGGLAIDMGKAIVVTDSGRVYATGKMAFPRTDEDMLTVGFDPDWAPRFTARYGALTSGDDEGGAIALGSGCVYVAGQSAGTLALIKYER